VENKTPTIYNTSKSNEIKINPFFRFSESLKFDNCTFQNVCYMSISLQDSSLQVLPRGFFLHLFRALVNDEYLKKSFIISYEDLDHRDYYLSSLRGFSQSVCNYLLSVHFDSEKSEIIFAVASHEIDQYRDRYDDSERNGVFNVMDHLWKLTCKVCHDYFPACKLSRCYLCNLCVSRMSLKEGSIFHCESIASLSTFPIGSDSVYPRLNLKESKESGHPCEKRSGFSISSDILIGRESLISFTSKVPLYHFMGKRSEATHSFSQRSIV